MNDKNAPADADRKGDWIITHQQVRFYPLDPRPDEVNLEDIAHALSNQCRWAGHTRIFYSVAQHAVMVAELVERIAPHLALMALHHDSSEAYLVDVPRPIKPLFEGYNAAEGRIIAAIETALSIPMPEWGWPLIKHADDAALKWEAINLLPSFPSWMDQIDVPPGLGEPTSLMPFQAKQLFIDTHNRLVKGRKERF